MRSKFKINNFLQESYDRQNNNFHIVRFILAMMVIYCHACVLLYPEYVGDFLAQFTNYQIDLGALAVHCFFVVSGFLITQSATHSSTVIDYLMKRILRIFPAFFVSLFSVAFIIGPLITSLSMSDYFKPDVTDPFKFVYKNLMFGVDGNVWGFKDLFSNNPGSQSANGSMWTLAHEFAMYLLFALFMLVGMIKRRISVIIILLVFFLALVGFFEVGYNPFPEGVVHWWVLNTWNYSKFIMEGFFFVSGALLFLYKDKIPYSRALFVSSLAGIYLFYIFGHLKLGLLLFLPYVVIYLCVNKKYAKFQSYGDYSYGLYIYSFPIQQTIVHINKEWTLPQYVVLSVVFSLIAALISWHLIEKPALKLKGKTRQTKKLSKKKIAVSS